MTKNLQPRPRADGSSEVRPERFRTALHDHARGELIWCSTSVQEVRTPDRVWIAPATGAVWIPPGQLHRSVTPFGGLEHAVYLDAELCTALPPECCIVELSAELRGAAEALSARGAAANEDGALLEALCREIRPAAVPSLANPLPELPTALRPILEAVEREPRDRRSLADWARFMHTSAASLRRCFQADVGRGFRAWRRQMALHAALEGLALGESSARIASRLGYASASSFAAAFRRELGIAPRAFFEALAPPGSPPAAPPRRPPGADARAAERELTPPAEAEEPGIEADWTRADDVCYFPRHSHASGELLWSPSGVQSVATNTGVWVVPSDRAIWVPAGCEHDLRLRGASALFFAFIDEGPGVRLPDRCCVVEASERVQGALRALAAHGRRVTAGDAHARSLLDGLRETQSAALRMPLEPPGKLEPVLAALRDDPASERRLDDWAAYLSMSPRTFARTFRREAGTSFSSFRRLGRLRFALEQLALGHDVTRTAELAGYRSVSMFVAMFHRALGTTPGRYWSRDVGSALYR